MSAEMGVRRSALRESSRRGLSSPRVQVLEMQRARLLSAAVVTAAELGWSGASVAHITARARVSRRTFYDLFASREECLIAVLDDVVARVTAEIMTADLQGLSWRERVRGGLWTILCFLDREPELARVCVLQSAAGGRRVLEWRAEILVRLAVMVDSGRGESRRTTDVPPLTAEGVVGAIVSIIYTRLLKGEREPLSDLLSGLMGMIVLPYLGAAAAGRESRRAIPRVARAKASHKSTRATGVTPGDPLREVPMRLTYRTARVLEAICENAGASNRVIAEHAGIYDQGQVSKLLARLEGLGLIENTSSNAHKPTGEPNAWRLTRRGEKIERTLRVGPADSQPRDNDEHKRSHR